MLKKISERRGERKGGVEIRIRNKQRKITIAKKNIARLAKQALKIKGIKQAELSILFVGKRGIRALNKKFRKIDRPTDVLAFSMREGSGGRLHPALPKIRKLSITESNWATPPLLKNIRKLKGKRKGWVNPEILGDVVICPQLSRRDGIDLCLVHGILHLLGYDDSDLKARSRMEKEQIRILEEIEKR